MWVGGWDVCVCVCVCCAVDVCVCTDSVRPSPTPKNNTQQIDLQRLNAERQGITEEQLKDQIEAKLLADKVLDFLASHADITWEDAKEV